MSDLWKIGQSAFKCYNSFDHTYQSDDLPNDMVALRVSDQTPSSGHEWYPDIGVTSHITKSSAHLHTFQPYAGNDLVMVGNMDYLPITDIWVNCSTYSSRYTTSRRFLSLSCYYKTFIICFKVNS